MNRASNHGEKEKRWQEIADWYTDRKKVGPIDPHILETVIALNALGIHTISSCEGHFDRGSGCPWIDIAPAEFFEYKRHIEEARQEMQRRSKDQRPSPEEVRQFITEVEPLQQDYWRQQLPDQQKLFGLLASFYEERRVPYERQLILYRHEGRTRMTFHGAILYATASTEVRRQKLQEYQTEMQEFTIFLKRRYFSSEENT